MKKNLLTLSLTFVLACTLSIVHAEEEVTAGNEANADVGKEKAAVCASCHGPEGNSMMPTFPKLAEQHGSYLVKQLQEFKEGVRKDPVMAPMAMGLSVADMADLGAYYAEQQISANPTPALPNDDDEEADDKKVKMTMQEVLTKGSNVYRNGNQSSQLSACIACHGPSGEGNKPAVFPALRSQHPDYLIKALKDFKSGARSNSPDNMMHMIAKKMTDEEIQSVSYYISTMR